MYVTLLPTTTVGMVTYLRIQRELKYMSIWK